MWNPLSKAEEAIPAVPTMPAHPYYPLEAEIVGYLANQYSVPMLLVLFASGCAAIISTTFLLVKQIRKTISNGELATIMWFTLCGFIHFFFEGYYVVNFRAMGGLQDLFGQLWKEYSLSDSRYLTLDPFVLCMESITAVSRIKNRSRVMLVTDYFIRSAGVPYHSLWHT
jgi:cholestenol delta-isomerase